MYKKAHYNYSDDSILQDSMEISNKFIVNSSSKPSKFEDSRVSETAKLEPANCMLCKSIQQGSSIHHIVSDALCKKYCSALDYYHSRDLQDILNRKPGPALFDYIDLRTLGRVDEFLKRRYYIHEYESKMKMLWKFHQFSLFLPILPAKSTFPLVLKHYYYKKNLHDRAIKHMLEVLTDEELENGEVDLADFMANNKERRMDSQQSNMMGRDSNGRKYQIDKASPIKNRMIFESEI